MSEKLKLIKKHVQYFMLQGCLKNDFFSQIDFYFYILFKNYKFLQIETSFFYSDFFKFTIK